MQSSNTSKYFLSSFFWSTLAKVLNAILGFISVPLLLGYFGKAEYGLLSIATACNGYMSLMDLGMNTGAIKFFSQWEAEGRRQLVHRVARTNISFYIIISIINIVGLLALAFWGEHLFSVTHEQFMQLRYCFYILALFSTLSWVTTAFNQLLTAYKMLDYTMKLQCVMTLLKGGLIAVVFVFGLSLTQYFFYLTVIVASLIIPYSIKCKKEELIDTLLPANYWGDFKTVLTFSISIFALSLFQVTATQSRPILLSIFSLDGADSVADYRIVEVVPQFIITVCGTFTSIFLPKASELLVKGTKNDIQSFVESWTLRTSILVCLLCFPFIVGANSILGAYVGPSFEHLGVWLQLWCLFLIIQMHSTPAFSIVLANGRTKVLVYTTATACVLSMIVNAVLCRIIPVGSAIVGYTVYMLCLIGVYYFYLYKHYLGVDRLKIALSFLKPFMLGIICCLIPLYLTKYFVSIIESSAETRVGYLCVFLAQSISWFIPYISLLGFMGLFKLSELKRIIK